MARVLFLVLAGVAAWAWLRPPRADALWPTGSDQGAGAPATFFDATLAELGQAASVVADAAGDVLGRVTQVTGITLGNDAPYVEYIASVESARGIPAGLVYRMAKRESGFRPDVINGKIRGSVGEIGILQMRPEYAADFGIDPLELTDPYVAIDAGAGYLVKMYQRFGSWPAAVVAWNWGPGVLASRGIAAAPASTKSYVAAVLPGSVLA